MTTASGVSVSRAVENQARRYGREPETLAGYGTALAVFAGTVGVAVAGARLAGRPAPSARPWDVVLLALATHKISRIIAKDSVTTPLRAPLTRFRGPAGNAEVTEEVRAPEGTHRHTMGELVTCPFCLDPWVATMLVAGRTFVPGLARAVESVFGSVAVADTLHLGYAAAQQRVTPPENRRDDQGQGGSS